MSVVDRKFGTGERQPLAPEPSWEQVLSRNAIERLRELANDSGRPITVYINSAGGNVTDGLAIHDAIRQVVHKGVQVTIVVQGMAYSMGSVVLQAASEGRRLALPHSWPATTEDSQGASSLSTSAKSSITRQTLMKPVWAGLPIMRLWTGSSIRAW